MTSLRSLAAYALLFAFPQLAAAQAASETNQAPDKSAAMLGYTPQSSATERDWEKKFQDGIVADNIRENMRRLSARPHHVGSPYDKDNAEWMLARFKEWGFDAHIETFDVLFPTPKERLLELVAPKPFKAKMQEPVLAVDPTSNQTSEQLPTYNAYSADGDVTAPAGLRELRQPRRLRELDRLGVSVKGAIVIARYGAGWRGIKPKVAAEHGAIGCIIYSDPRGDGYFNGDDYPNRRLAAARRRAARQRDGYRLSRRSADSGRRRDSGCEAARHQRRQDDHENSGAADFVRRCAAVARSAAGPGRSGRLARRLADHLSRRPRPRASASESRFELGH